MVLMIMGGHGDTNWGGRAWCATSSGGTPTAPSTSTPGVPGESVQFTCRTVPRRWERRRPTSLSDVANSLVTLQSRRTVSGEREAPTWANNFVWRYLRHAQTFVTFLHHYSRCVQGTQSIDPKEQMLKSQVRDGERLLVQSYSRTCWQSSVQIMHQGIVRKLIVGVPLIDLVKCLIPGIE